MGRRYPCVFLWCLAGTLAVLCLALPPVWAEQPTLSAALPEPQAQQPQPSSPQTSTDQPEKPKAPDTATREQRTGTSNERLFWVLPDFLLIQNTKQLPPLSPSAKFKVAARTSFDYVNYPLYGIVAGLSQAQNSEPAYGHGFEGYAKRYGSAFADGTIEGFMTSAVLPSILRQDPRYYQLGQGGFWRRSAYAVSRIFVTRADSGKIQFNASEIVGSGLAGAISTYSYHPTSERTVRNSLQTWGTQVSYDTVWGIVNEFWPDIRRRLSKK
jgi:hypothetical protein